jgi:hypothetical protein
MSQLCGKLLRRPGQHGHLLLPRPHAALRRTDETVRLDLLSLCRDVAAKFAVDRGAKGAVIWRINIKAKFGSAIRSKTPVAQENEVLCKVLCHNLCCLVQSIYELGIEPEFWKAS